VDPRRANLSQESLATNVARLKAYRERLIIFPRKSGQFKKMDTSKEDIEKHAKQGSLMRKHMPVVDPGKKMAITEVKKSEMPEGTKDAYRTLREARSAARLVGVREKRAKVKAEEATAAKK